MSSEQRPPVEHIERQASVDVSVRRSPRYGRFLLVGAIIGVIFALIVASITRPTPEEIAGPTITYSFSAVFGFGALLFGAIGALLSGLLALLLDRLVGRRLRPYTAEHEHVAYDEPEDEEETADAPAAESGSAARTDAAGPAQA